MSRKDDDYEKELKTKLLKGIVGSESKRPVYENQLTVGRKEKTHDLKNVEEDSMIDLLDLKRELRYLAPIYERLQKGTIDVQGAINKTAKVAYMKVIQLMLMGKSEKVQADVAKHLLALAGHTVTQKVELGRIDPETPKNALISQISGASKDLEAEGFEIIDDRAEAKDKD